MKTFLKIVLTALVSIQFQIQAQIQSSDTNLHMAVLQGNLETVKQLVESEVDLDVKDQYGSTPLIIAATFGKYEAAKVLIEGGADMNITNNQGSTPLHISAFFGRIEIVEALLGKGADTSVRNNDGATAYDIVSAPVEMDRESYEYLQSALEPLGLKVDLNQIKEARPRIATLLSESSNYERFDYSPMKREDWEVSIPAALGLNKEVIDQLYFDASQLKTLYALLVIKDGYLIAEGYFNEASVDQLDKRASVTKSYVSALIGIALDEGYISGIDQKMVEFFPEIENSMTDPRKKDITLKQMLQMRSGYPWEETKEEYWNTIWSGKYIDAIVDIPLAHDPGSTFQYSNLTSNWLSMIISRASKEDLKSFGEKHLFSPLNVRIGDWPKDLDGYRIGSGDIEFTARDMARFGLLYLNEGQINGKQIVPNDWVRQSLQNYSPQINSVGVKSGRLGRYFNNVGYGYQWWSASVGEHQFNFAWGHGGQLIVLLHDLNMVIVTTADPFYGKEAHFNAWKHEQAVINLVGKFISSLP